MTEPKPSAADWASMLAGADLSKLLIQQRQESRDELRAALTEFLRVLDALDRLAAHADGDSDASLNRLRRLFEQAFGACGVEFIATVGCPFDPALHEAVGHRKVLDAGPDSVVDEVRRGCTHEGELLRAAQVIVAEQT